MMYNYSSGSYYEGDIVDGSFTGKGKFYFYNGDIYDGEFCEDKFHGFGKYVYKSGDTYTGYFENDEFHGIGTYIFKCDVKEKGKYHKGKRVGKFVYLENEVYSIVLYNNDVISFSETTDPVNVSVEKLP